MNSTVSSGLASNGAPFFSAEFGVTSHAVSILPTSLFLLGYVLGPVVFGPMSEQYGRKIVSIAAFVFFSIWTMACALAPNMASLIVFRFLCGIGASCPIVVVGGTCADVFSSPVSRGRAMAIFMVYVYGVDLGHASYKLIDRIDDPNSVHVQEAYHG